MFPSKYFFCSSQVTFVIKIIKFYLSTYPWWYGEKDRKYEEWEESPVKWIPPILKTFDFKPFSLNFLVGSR
jgi:hypothetical protein